MRTGMKLLRPRGLLVFSKCPRAFYFARFSEKETHKGDLTMSMTVAQLQAALDKIEDKQRNVQVSVGNPMVSADFGIEEVFDSNFSGNDIVLLCFAEGEYSFGEYPRHLCQNCGNHTFVIETWRDMVVCPQCKADLTADKGPDMEEAVAAAEARRDAEENR